VPIDRVEVTRAREAVPTLHSNYAYTGAKAPLAVPIFRPRRPRLRGRLK
jgi:hypothetical protein